MRTRTLVIIVVGLATCIGSTLWLQLGHTPPAGWGYAAVQGGFAGVVTANAVRVFW